MQLSRAIQQTIMALGSDARLVVSTLRTTDAEIETDDWRADVARSEGEVRFTVPINSFRKMRREGYLAKEREWVVSGRLVHSEYRLTDKARAWLSS